MTFIWICFRFEMVYRHANTLCRQLNYHIVTEKLPTFITQYASINNNVLNISRSLKNNIKSNAHNFLLCE